MTDTFLECAISVSVNMRHQGNISNHMLLYLLNNFGFLHPIQWLKNVYVPTNDFDAYFFMRNKLLVLKCILLTNAP